MVNKIKHYLDQFDLDLRNTGYRYMDQKVTPDVLSFIADCTLNLSEEKLSDFTKNDIWHSDYFKKNVRLIYNKPSADNRSAASEYDKFTAQPLKTLSYARILTEKRIGRENHYKIENRDILEFISINTRNAFTFLRIYLEHVFTDSGFYHRIQSYISDHRNGNANQDTFSELKQSFERFMIGHTKINNKTEVRRIFPKVINIFAVDHGVPGSERGRMSKGNYLYSDLMYNRVNFRDLNKLKNITREEAEKLRQEQITYSQYEVRKAKQAVKKRHYPISEVKDRFGSDEATQVHHIFPDNMHPELSAVLENLILITPQQHNTKAHPNNNTQDTDLSYQIVCLKAKAESVKKSEAQDDGFYSKENFIDVINTGLDLGLDYDDSFDTIMLRLDNVI